MLDFQPLPYGTDATGRRHFYSQLTSEIESSLDQAWFTNLATASASLYAQLPRLNWAGFYLACDNELVLGPFQGLPACLRIPVGKGVCGAVAASRKSLIVDDVLTFPGHIACDSRSRSEIVIPLQASGSARLLGVLDVDSPDLARFDDEDRIGLEGIVARIVNGTRWPERF